MPARWYIPGSAIAAAVRRVAPGKRPPLALLAPLERLCLRAAGRLPHVPMESARTPGRASAGYKKALVKAIRRACCAPDLRRW